MKAYCRAVLRPEGIACTLFEGHGPYTSTEEGWTTDHCNVGGNRIFQRHPDPDPREWGFNNPIGRKLEDE